MTLTLYNTLTRRKEEFRPIDPANVRMYVCGPTVYDFAHIGNARPVIVFDVLFRLLRHIYGPEHVTYARNITDVDDKINARAVEEYPGLPLNEAIAKVTEKTERQFHADIAALGVLVPDDVNRPGKPPVFVEPRATQHIEEMKALIEALVARGNAYVGEGHVLFDVSSMPDYGRFANRSLEEMEAGARVDVAPYKKGPMDFVLWKPSKPGEPAWPSPAGIAAPGRPGWHIECSAMADKWLWEEVKGTLSAAGLARPHVFDIHGGGIDLVFPHHENEIAQSRCAHGTSAMANYWMHNGFLQVEGEKMSKSLGNFVTINELVSEAWPGDVLRFNMLRTHYRQPIDWTATGLEETFDAYFSTLDIAEEYDPAPLPDHAFVDALSDDLNTPQAIARLFELREAARKGDIDAGASLRASMALVGFGAVAREDTSLVPASTSSAKSLEFWMSRFTRNYPLRRALRVLEKASGQVDDQWLPGAIQLLHRAGYSARVGDVRERAAKIAEVNELIDARNAARKAKNFKEADRIRDELAGMGIQLKDAKDPASGEIVTTWEVKR